MYLTGDDVLAHGGGEWDQLSHVLELDLFFRRRFFATESSTVLEMCLSQNRPLIDEHSEYLGARLLMPGVKCPQMYPPNVSAKCLRGSQRPNSNSPGVGQDSGLIGSTEILDTYLMVMPSSR